MLTLPILHTTAFANGNDPAAEAAPPANNDCAGATTLTSGTSCVTTAGTTVDATQSIAAITCATYTGTADDDVWYKFVAVATTHTVTVVGSSNFDAVIDVRSGACNGTNIGCADATTSGGTEVATVSGLTIGTTYYARVYSYGGTVSNQGTFTICVTHSGFDPCSSIVSMSCGTAVTATPSGAGVWSPTTSCGFTTPGQEKIYSFTPTSTGVHNLQVTSATGGYIDYFFKAASGGCVSTGWTCLLDISSAATVTMGTLTAGTQYYILLDPEGSGAYSHTFQINCPTGGPANNECSAATTLVSSVSCTSTAGTTVNATQSIPAITCGSFTGTADDDVWYKFVAVSTTHTVTVVGSSSFDAVIDVRSGACNGTNIGCADGTFSGGTEMATIGGLTIGATYYVRVYSYGSTSTTQGTFNICVTHNADPCGNITTLACATPATVTLSGAGQWSTTICGFTVAGQEKVYSFTPATTGSYSLQVTSSSGGYIDYAYKAASGGCSNSGWTCIDDISIASTVTIGTLTAGTQYYILLDAESTSSVTHTFQIVCPAAGPANNECSAATTLTSSTTCTPTSGTTVGATQSIAAISCNSATGTADDDVWYQFVAVAATQTVTVVGASGFDAVIDVRSGACNGTNIGCADATSGGGTEVATISGLTIGNNYYVRVYSYGSTSGNQGTFSICVTHTQPTPPCVPAPTAPANGASLCQQAVTLSWPTSSGATSYDVYFGTASTPPFVSNVTGTTYTTSTLTAGTYYWQIRPVGPGGTATGCTIWSFTVQNEPTGNTFGNPIVVGSLPYSASGNNLSANCWTSTYTGANAQASPDVFYSFSVNACQSRVEVSLCGSTFDTYVHVLNSSGTQIAFNDDNGPLCSGTQASLRLDNLAAGTYYVVVEGSGSSTGDYTLNITASDITPPTITCPANIVQANTTGQCSANVTFSNASGSDNCPGFTVTQISGIASGGTFPVGTTTNTFRVTDASGNSTTCSFTVTVNDTQVPVLNNCPAGQSVSVNSNCQATLADYRSGVSVSDNCTFSGSVQQSPAPGTVFSSNTTVTLSATDAGGNTGTCTFIVTIIDNTAPSITCPTAQTLAVGSNCQVALPNYTSLGNASDNCTASPTKTQSPASGTTVTVGFSVVTLTATDAAGNTNTCTFTVIVSDNTPPTITCPANIVQGNTPNQCSANVTFSNPTANDNCSGFTVTQTAGLASGSVFPVGTTNNTFRVTDASGNTTTCTFTVTVNDTQAPVLSNCPVSQAVSVNSNCQGVMADYRSGVSALDNCPGMGTIQQSPAPGSIFSGTTTVTLSATDAAGNTGTCTFNLTVADNTAPSITCPAAQTLSAGANCQIALPNYTSLGTASDNCTLSPTKTQSPAIGTLVGLGTTVVTLTATDAAGNTNTCTFTVAVSDNTPPTITCPANTTIAANGTCSSSLGSYSLASISDNCSSGGYILSQSPSSSTVLNGHGTTQTVTLAATDAAGNTSSCTFTVTLRDNTAPSVTCPANITQANTTGQCGANVTFANASGSDNCGTPIITQISGPASGSLFPVGTTSVTFRSTDFAGNSTTCSFSVTVNDTQTPTITCPANITQANTTGQCGANVSFATATGSDNCGTPPVTQIGGQSSGSFFPVGTTAVTFRATDAAGNSLTCSFSITVNDTQAPSITCPANITQPNTTGQCGANVTFANATATDNCTASPTVTQISGPTSGSLFPVGTTAVTFRATDAAGNSTTCSFNVTVNDTQAPSITCPANITQANTTGQCGANVTFANATGSDNCSTPTITQIGGLASGSFFPVGTTAVTFRATDTAGNSLTCSFSVTVNDTQAPSITCLANITQANTTGQCGANVTFANATGTDNCAAPTITQTGGSASGSFFPVGTTAVTFRATDAAGNSTTCSFNVTVNDTQLPTITCPANITQSNTTGQCGANVTFANATGTDNCAAPTITNLGAASGSFFAVGTSAVTFRATDAAGNSLTCSFTITVNDTQAPTITCPANQTLSNNTNLCSAVATYSTPTGTDNCAAPTITRTQGSASGSAFPVGANVIIHRATDAAGNSTTCSFTITVNDTQAPAITCPANQTLSSNAGTCSAVATYTTPTATDNCSGTPTITRTQGLASGSAFPVGANVIIHRATDVAGNSSTCSFTITVNDGQAPVITCPANQTVSANASCSGTVGSWSPVSVSDNCTASGSIAVTQTPAPTTPLNGHNASTTVTLTASDASGNTTRCTFTVTLRDVTPPVLTCKNASVSLGANGSLTLPPATVSNSSSDNCGVTLSVSPNTFGCANIGNNTVVLRATDPGGNMTTCTAVVTIRDLSAPTALCKNINVFLDELGQTSITAADVNNGSYDGCGIASTSININQFNCSDIGGSPKVVQLTVRDNYNNQSTCLAYVTVKDAIAPIPVCQDITVQLNAQRKVTVYGNTLADNSSDNCSVWSYSPIAKVYTCANLGANQLTVTVKDYSNNAATCVSTVTVLPPASGCGNFGNDSNNRDEEATGETGEIFSLSFFPNPTSGNVTLSFELPTAQEVNLRLMDMNGRVLRSEHGNAWEGENAWNLELGDVPSGIYMLEFRSGEQREVKRLVVQRN